MAHQKTGGSTDGNLTTGLYGTQSHGSSEGCFFCPLHREVVPGAEIYLKWLRTHRTVSTMVSPGILISNYQDVTLCVCNVPAPSIGGWCCALDAEGKIITVLQEKYVGTANQQKSGNDSCTSETKRSMTRDQFLNAITDMRIHYARLSEKTGSGSGCRDEKN